MCRKPCIKKSTCKGAVKVTKFKKIVIFLSAVFLIIVGNKINSDFMKKNNIITEPEKNERGTASV